MKNRWYWAVVALVVVVVAVVVWYFVLRPAGKERPTSWSSPPRMSIDATKKYYATIVTDKGDIRVELLADKAPNTVNNFVFLARNRFYDGIMFHRVLPGFMAQTGDPTGTGGGGPGYVFDDEFHAELSHDSAGVVSMANGGPNANGSQFFITYAPQLHLDGLHSIFGRVVGGMDVVNSLTPRDPSESPDGPADLIKSITIEEE